MRRRTLCGYLASLGLGKLCLQMIENGLRMTTGITDAHPYASLVCRRAALPGVRFSYVPQQLKISSSFRGM
ncbi:hypothetical protein Ancab_004384 [Ancistrocladus abbreviatus]